MKIKRAILKKIIKEEISKYSLLEQRIDQPVWFEAEQDNIMQAYASGDQDKIDFALRIRDANNEARGQFIEMMFLNEPGFTITQVSLGILSFVDITSLTEIMSAALYTANGDTESAVITASMMPLAGGPIVARFAKLAKALGATDDAVKAVVKGVEAGEGAGKTVKKHPGTDDIVAKAIRTGTKGMKLTAKQTVALTRGMSAISKSRKYREMLPSIQTPWSPPKFNQVARNMGKFSGEIREALKVAKKARKAGATHLDDTIIALRKERDAINQSLKKVYSAATNLAIRDPEKYVKMLGELDTTLAKAVDSTMSTSLRNKILGFGKEYKKSLIAAGVATGVIAMGGGGAYVIGSSDMDPYSDGFGATDAATGLDLDTGEAYGDWKESPTEPVKIGGDKSREDEDEEDDDDTGDWDPEDIKLNP